LKVRIAEGFAERDVLLKDLPQLIEEKEDGEILCYSETYNFETSISQNCQLFEEWFDFIINSVSTKIECKEGDHDNLQFMPSILKYMRILIKKKLPLWSAIMTPVFKYGSKTSSNEYPRGIQF
jgi:hypothetical protein